MVLYSRRAYWYVYLIAISLLATVYRKQTILAIYSLRTYINLFHSVYISGRPFVLRDSSEPRRTMSISDRAENLEAIENRLKNDILQETNRYVC